MLESVTNYIKFEEVVPELDGYRTRIVYDSPAVKDLVALQHIVPHFSKNKDVYLVLYSEALYYKFKKRVEGLLRKIPELKRAISKLKIVKVGLKSECEYGELVHFIKQGKPRSEFKELVEALLGLDENSVLILYGSIAYYMISTSYSDLKNLIDLFSVLPERITLFGFRQRNTSTFPEDSLLEDLYDVVIYVTKDRQSFDEFTYNFRVECHLGSPCYRCGKLRIENGLLVSL